MCHVRDYVALLMSQQEQQAKSRKQRLRPLDRICQDSHVIVILLPVFLQAVFRYAKHTPSVHVSCYSQSYNRRGNGRRMQNHFMTL